MLADESSDGMMFQLEDGSFSQGLNTRTFVRVSGRRLGGIKIFQDYITRSSFKTIDML